MRWPTNAKRANASDEYVAGVEGRRTTERQGARHQQEAGHGSHAQDGLLGMSAGFLCAAAWYCVIDHSFTLPQPNNLENWATSRLSALSANRDVVCSCPASHCGHEKKRVFLRAPKGGVHAYNVTNSFNVTRIDIVVRLRNDGDTGSVALTATVYRARRNVQQRIRYQGLCAGTKARRKLPKRQLSDNDDHRYWAGKPQQ